MAGRKWSLEEATEAVTSAGHRVDSHKRVVTPTRFLGNKCWGAVDYLTKHHGFTFDWEEYRRIRKPLLAAASLD
jgi:hypothetical protein